MDNYIFISHLDQPGNDLYHSSKSIEDNCLIATNDPLEYCKTHLNPIVDKLKDKVDIKSIHKKYESYLSEMSRYNESVEKIKAKYTSDEKIDEEVARLKIPKFEFVKSLEINTDSHIKSFAKYVKSYDSSMLKNSINPEKINITEFLVDDNLKFLLYMGVGLYSKDLDPDYTNKVLEMLQERELAYIIADESFCYGANYLISNVVIMDDIGNPHSINTILQLIGRTARIGKSWSGKVYLDTNTSDRIKRFFMNPTFTSVEGDNIRTFFNNTKKEIEKKKEQKEQNEQKQREIQIQKELKLKKEMETEVLMKQSKLNKELELTKQVIGKETGFKIIKENAPIVNPENLDNNLDNNLDSRETNSQNEIYSWKRGKTFKSGNPNPNPNPSSNLIPNPEQSNNSDLNNSESNKSGSVWSLGNSKEKKNVLDEWVGIRGKNKTIQSELFVPKSYDELNCLKTNDKSNDKSNENTKKTEVNFKVNQSDNLMQQSQSKIHNNYAQFDNLNMFKRGKNFTQNKSGQQEQKTKLEPEQNSPDKLPEDLKNKQFRNKNNKTNK